MITRQYDLDIQLPAFSFIGQPPEKCVFFDIETTGFKAAFSEVYLIGAAVCNAGRWRIFQWMSEHPSEEDALLRTFAAFARPYGCLVHFNGNRFDLPYLQEKYDAHKIPCSLPSLRSVDLFTQFKPLRSLLELDHVNQKSLESFLGIVREDRFSGGELIEVYRSFTRSPARHLSELLLLHNMEDVKGMLRLTDLFAYRQLDTLFPEVSARLLLPAAGSGSKDSSGCEAAPGSLEITCVYPLRFPVPVCKSTAWGTLLLQENMSSLQVLIRCGQLLHFFENYKEYYYLPKRMKPSTKASRPLWTRRTASGPLPAPAIQRRPEASSRSSQKLIFPVFSPLTASGSGISNCLKMSATLPLPVTTGPHASMSCSHRGTSVPEL